MGNPVSDKIFDLTLSGHFVAYVRDYLLDRNIAPQPLFAACDIQWRDDDVDIPMPVAKIAALLNAAAEASRNSCMGIHMAQNYHYEAGSPLIWTMLAAPTVQWSLQILHRYDRFIDTGITTTFDFSESTAEFGARVLCDDEIDVSQLDEYMMVFTVQTLYRSTRRKMPLEEVWLLHENERNRKTLEKYFQAPVRFGQVSNQLFFDRGYLKTRNLTRNKLLFDVLTNALKAYYEPSLNDSSLVDRVAREIINSQDGMTDGAEQIAERLAISARTLRRRLADEGCSFQEAKNIARERHARYFLEHTSMPLTEIALKLGFSELSSFIRAFRTWTGDTPQSHRDQARHAGNQKAH